MKKLAVLTSVLVLAACGGGSGGGHGSSYTSSDTRISNIQIPTQHTISEAIKESNEQVTGIVYSVNNAEDMTNNVAEAIGGEEVLASINPDNTATSVNTQNARSASVRHSALKMPAGANSLSDLAKSAYVFLEGGKKFNEWSRAKRQQFLSEQRELVQYWGKVFCGCDMSAYTTDDAILGVFENTANKNRFKNFYNNNHYREYTLENVDFTMAAASGGRGDEGGSKDILKFNLGSDGRIDSVTHTAYIVNNKGKLVESPLESAGTMTRNTENIFDVKQVHSDGTVITGSGTFFAYGNDIGLKYSDFGQLKYNLMVKNPGQANAAPEKSFEPFAGGYKDLRHESVNTNMNFNGKAVGSLAYASRDENNDRYEDNKRISGLATLNFNIDGGTKTKTETLTMNFSNPLWTEEDDMPWYNVKIVRNQTSGANSITFTNTDGVANIPGYFKFESTEFNNNERTINNYLVDGYNGVGYPDDKAAKGKLDIGYYGITDNNITEATGVTQYVENFGNFNENKTGSIRMNVGFGMKKTEQP